MIDAYIKLIRLLAFSALDAPEPTLGSFMEFGSSGRY